MSGPSIGCNNYSMSLPTIYTPTHHTPTIYTPSHRTTQGDYSEALNLVNMLLRELKKFDDKQLLVRFVAPTP